MGKARKHREAMIARAIELKKAATTAFSPGHQRVLAERIRSHDSALRPSIAISAWLEQRVANSARPTKKIRCRWTRDHSNALWVGDFSEGPYVFHAGRVIKSHLSIWIDCHSRYVVEGRYYFRENLDIVIDSLLRAWGSHGASREIYLDNAKVYHAGALKLACAQLNIQLLHRPPRGTFSRRHH